MPQISISEDYAHKKNKDFYRSNEIFMPRNAMIIPNNESTQPCEKYVVI